MEAPFAQMLGANGGKYVSDTNAQTGEWRAIQCLTETTFSALTNTIFTGSFPTGTALAAGTVIYGHITAFTLTSGNVAAINV